jgi:hypothetical protein
VKPKKNLAFAVCWFWQSSRGTKPAENAAVEHPSMEGFTPASPESVPPTLAPVELSPERMQSIGGAYWAGRIQDD